MTYGPAQQLNACPNCASHLDVTEFEPFSKVICPQCEETIRVRHQFHHFVIKEEIGVGGMSRVFRALDSALNREVALKILNRQCSSDEKRVEQFEREARITASISHPNVVKVFSSGWDQGYFYIAMELVTGGTLDRLIRDGALPEPKLLEVALQAARGFKAAYDVGLIHRDIKPGNILFAADGTPKIVDFGLALMLQEMDTDTEIWATPFYVPPEKLFSEPEDHRSDIYSLGATLFHAAYGRPPYQKDTNNMLELREMKSHPVSLKKSEQAKLSKTTTEILLACLERQPKNRPQDYPTLLLQLEYAVRNKGGLRALMHPTKPLWARPAVWGTAAALGVASLGYVATRPATTPVPSGSANGERLVIIEDPSDNRDQNLSQQYNDARKRLLSSDAAGALLSFSNAGLSAPQPTKNWCHLHVALCHWFLGQPAEAEKALEPLNPGIPGPTAAFFTEARPILLGTSTDQSHIHKAFPREGYECMGLLALGLKSWSQGDAKSAKEAWDSLLAGDAKKQSWAAAYRPWIEQLAKQATQIATLPQLRAEDPQLLANFEKTKQTLANLPASPIAEKAKKALNIHQEAISNAQQQSEAAMATKENAEINSFLATLHTHTLADLPQLEQTLKTKVFQAKLTKNRQAALADCFQQSHQLLEILPTELTPTQSEIRLHVAEGKVLMGKLLRVDKQQLVIQTGTVETPVDWTQLPAAAWLELAETNLDQMRKLEATDYYAKRQQLVSFALCTGQKYTAKVKAAALCREWPAFRETWAVLAPP